MKSVNIKFKIGHSEYAVSGTRGIDYLWMRKSLPLCAPHKEHTAYNAFMLGDGVWRAYKPYSTLESERKTIYHNGTKYIYEFEIADANSYEDVARVLLNLDRKNGLVL